MRAPVRPSGTCQPPDGCRADAKAPGMGLRWPGRNRTGGLCAPPVWPCARPCACAKRGRGGFMRVAWVGPLSGNVQERPGAAGWGTPPSYFPAGGGRARGAGTPPGLTRPAAEGRAPARTGRSRSGCEPAAGCPQPPSVRTDLAEWHRSAGRCPTRKPSAYAAVRAGVRRRRSAPRRKRRHARTRKRKRVRNWATGTYPECAPLSTRACAGREPPRHDGALSGAATPGGTGASGV